MRTRLSFVVAVAGVAVSSVGYGQDYSNMLGDPGFSGSYVSGFTVHDDGNGDARASRRLHRRPVALSTRQRAGGRARGEDRFLRPDGA